MKSPVISNTATLKTSGAQALRTLGASWGRLSGRLSASAARGWSPGRKQVLEEAALLPLALLRLRDSLDRCYHRAISSGGGRRHAGVLKARYENIGAPGAVPRPNSTCERRMARCRGVRPKCVFGVEGWRGVTMGDRTRAARRAICPLPLVAGPPGASGALVGGRACGPGERGRAASTLRRRRSRPPVPCAPGAGTRVLCPLSPTASLCVQSGPGQGQSRPASGEVIASMAKCRKSSAEMC